MRNKDIKTALAYHEATKLVYINLRNKPPAYKSYADLPVLPLPKDVSLPDVLTLDAVTRGVAEGGPPVDLAMLARLLFFSAGLIRKTTFPASGELHFRAASSAGALYPIEVYLVCGDIPGLGAGVYHFSPSDFGLHLLRKGDYRSELSQAAGGDERVAASPATLVYTTVFWRSAWKYRVRSYRYCFWDAGTVSANLLATASACGLSAQLLVGFVDTAMNRLIGADGEHEAAVCLIPVGDRVGRPSGNPTEQPLQLSSDPLGRFEGEIDYPEIQVLHTASSLSTKEEVAAWRGGMQRPAQVQRGTLYPLPVNPETGESSDNVENVIKGRGSTRRFSRVSIPYDRLGAILESSTTGVSADFLERRTSLLDVYVVANAVEGLPSGLYFFNPDRQGLEMLREGTFREEAGHMCLEQAIGADSSAVVFLMANLEPILEHYGNRGYRAAQLEAGVIGGRMYLCAHSLGVGATGTTFYDNDVTSFLSPHAEGKSTIFAVTLGVPDTQNRVRGFRSRVGAILDSLARGTGSGRGPFGFGS